MSDMLFVLPIMMLSNRIDFTDPTNIMLARTAYIGLEVILLGFCFYVYNSILKEKNQKKIKVPPQPAGFGQEPGPAIEQTIEEYDMAKLKQYVQELVVQFAIVLFIHYKWDLAPPLILQAAMNPIRFYKSKLIQAHVFGNDVPRPYPEEPNPLAALLGGQQAEAPAAEGEGPAPGTIEELPSEPASSEAPKKAKVTQEKPAKEAKAPKQEKAMEVPKVAPKKNPNPDLKNDEVPNDLQLID